ACVIAAVREMELDVRAGDGMAGIVDDRALDLSRAVELEIELLVIAGRENDALCQRERLLVDVPRIDEHGPGGQASERVSTGRVGARTVAAVLACDLCTGDRSASARDVTVDL